MVVEEVERYIEKGNEEIDAENYAEALNYFNKALKIDSK